MIGVARSRRVSQIEMLAELARSPFDAFDADVKDATGRVHYGQLAEVIGVPLIILAGAFGVAYRSLRARSAGEKARRSAILLLDLANELAWRFESNDDVRVYFRTPQRDFAGRTPAMLLADGQLRFLRSYVRRHVVQTPPRHVLMNPD